MNKYLKKEIITPLVTIIFLAVYALEAMKLSPPIVNSVPQETFFPVIIVVFGMIAAVSLLVSALRKFNVSGSADEKKPMNRKPVYIALLTVALIFLFETLGFFILAPVYLFAMMLIFDDKPQQFFRKIIYSALVTGFIYFVYVFIFDIRFPQIWR